MSDSPLIIRLPAASAGKLAALRLAAGLQVARDDQFIWLRVETKIDSLDAKLRGLPHAERFIVVEADALAREGDRVPSAVLPQLDWQPLAKFVQPNVPAVHLAARGVRPAGVSLTNDPTPREPNMLLTTLETWIDYATTAPQVRLACWTFAVDSDRQVIIRGAPVPPIRGARFVEQHGVAVEAGYRIDPPIVAEVLAKSWQVEPGELIVLAAEAPPLRIAAENFVAASRSAARLTAERFADVN